MTHDDTPETEQHLALPWAHTMPAEDLHNFLDSLVSAALNRWRTGPSGAAIPDQLTLADIEKACAQWRTPGRGHRSDEVIPRTELSYWVAIAAALNAAVAAGMPIGIDLDGTLTDHNAWSVVYDRDSQQWETAGYDDGFTATAPSEEKDTHTGSQPVWDGFTAREEIIGVLISAGYNEAAAKELLGRADREPHAPVTEDEFPATLAGGHALIVEDADIERYGACQCGKRLGTIPPHVSPNALVPSWQLHLIEVGN